MPFAFNWRPYTGCLLVQTCSLTALTDLTRRQVLFESSLALTHKAPIQTRTTSLLVLPTGRRRRTLEAPSELLGRSRMLVIDLAGWSRSVLAREDIALLFPRPKLVGAGFATDARHECGFGFRWSCRAALRHGPVE